MNSSKRNARRCLLTFLLLLFFAARVPAADASLKVTTGNPGLEHFDADGGVQLDFGLTDQNGNPVGNLRPDNVKVFEDGKEAKIIDFRGVGQGRPVDIVFVLDVTESMQPYIDAVKQNMISFARDLQANNRDYRLGLVTFEDYTVSKYPDCNCTYRNQLTSNVNEFIGWVGSLHAGGGGDIPEDQLDALAYASTLPLRPDAQAILTDIVKAPDKASLRRAAAAISNWKNALLDPDAALEQAGDEAEMQFARAYLSYQATLKAYQAMDFDDLIRLPVDLFQSESEALERWQGRLGYLLVDEYQDTNGAQYALMKLLAGPAGRFTAVGDDDQAIYAWRGADVENLRRLGEDYCRLKLIPRTQNYRSSRRILAAANRVIRHNSRLHDKTLWSELGTGEPIRVVDCKDDRHEAESVAVRIDAHRFQSRNRFSDYAVLYRGNHQARVLEEAMRAAKIPYLLSGGQSFFDRSEIKDFTAYLRLIANPDDDPAFIRAATTPRRGIGPVAMERLGRYAAGLRLLGTHERTHCFHLARAGGVWSVRRLVFGRAPGLFPNEYQPPWVAEGLAVYYESRFTTAGRERGAYHTLGQAEAVLRSLITAADAAVGPDASSQAVPVKVFYLPNGTLVVETPAVVWRFDDGLSAPPSYIRRQAESGAVPA